MSNPYIQNTSADVEEMLAAIGAASIDEIFNEQVPEELQKRDSFDLPRALSEPELQSDLTRLAAKNLDGTKLVSFMGGGIYDHFVPSAIMHVANRQEYVTGYTPYQPEASQGLLQAFFEYQTLISRLFEMPVSNASLYDGASALGEAVFLALSINPDRTRIIMPETLHPEYRELVATYLRYFDCKIDVVKHSAGKYDLEALDEYLGDDVAAVVVQHPNYFGCLEEVEQIEMKTHGAGALLISVADPLAAGVIAPPGQYKADIAVGEGQPMGLNPYAGGESLGLFTCQQEFIRKVPGRLVGVARDRMDRKGFVLTLQTREQHIRRAKATSNICTNHAHNALRATIYLCLMGPQGLERVAKACARNTARLRKLVSEKNAKALVWDTPVFKEFVVRCNRPAVEVRDALVSLGYLGGVPLSETMGKGYEDMLLVSVTEKRTDQEIDSFAKELGAFL